MTPVDQTTFASKGRSSPPGNCLSACVASILDMPIRSVPTFVDSRDPSAVAQSNGIFWEPHDYLWTRRLDAWLEGMGLETSYHGPRASIPDFYILYGYAPSGHEHAVVARAGHVVHDPHPSHTGLAVVTGAIAITPIRTSKSPSSRRKNRR